MDPVRIIFFDVDGTLIDPATGCISEKTFHALHKLQQKGILICIATGRPTASLPDLKDLRPDVICAFNGSLCYTDSAIIHSVPINRQDVATVMENAARIGRPVSLATKDRLVANGIDKDLSDYYRLADLTLTVSEDFDKASQEDIYQIMLGYRETDRTQLLQNTRQVKIALSWDRAADIIPKMGGKGSAVKKILAYFGLHAEQAMAFGDSYNDIQMLQAVGHGIAMGNAPEELKAVAAEVCGSVSQDGIYHYCLTKGLI